jgi:hypothetical protein
MVLVDCINFLAAGLPGNLVQNLVFLGLFVPPLRALEPMYRASSQHVIVGCSVCSPVTAMHPDFIWLAQRMLRRGVHRQRHGIEPQAQCNLRVV